MRRFEIEKGVVKNWIQGVMKPFSVICFSRRLYELSTGARNMIASIFYDSLHTSAGKKLTQFNVLVIGFVNGRVILLH